MINIIYSDESNHLTSGICELFEQAAEEALNLEFKEDFAALGLDPEKIDSEISVTIVDDEEIRELNRDYRSNDKVTDVLSFPQFEGHEEILSEFEECYDNTTVLVGDVVICYDQAIRQSEEYGTGARRELVYLFIHSIMHLFGYDHMEEEERKLMRSKEESVLKTIGVK